jgi:hypothetical protein
MSFFWTVMPCGHVGGWNYFRQINCLLFRVVSFKSCIYLEVQKAVTATRQIFTRPLLREPQISQRIKLCSYEVSAIIATQILQQGMLICNPEEVPHSSSYFNGCIIIIFC